MMNKREVMITCNCIKTDFSHCDLKGALLWGCNLKGANFSGADLTNAKIIACDIREVNFTDAVLDGIDLSGSVYSSDALENNERTQRVLSQSKRNFPLKKYLAGRSIRK